MVLVTGGAGFIGSNIVKGLNDRGYKDIVIVDDLTDGTKHKNMNKLEFTDYIDYEDLTEEYLDTFDIDIVFHQGACADTTEADGRFMMNVNYRYTVDLWHYCMANDIRFIYASSASVYGDGKDGFREEPACEDPLNVYAFSKYQIDRYLRQNGVDAPDFDESAPNEAEKLAQTVALRYFNVYGPQENHKGAMASVAYHLYHQVKNGEPMKLFEGSENFRRDFIHVDDIVAVNMFFFENKDISGIFNCGTGRAESFVEIANAMQKAFPAAKIERIPFPAHLVGKYQEFTEANIAKLRKAGYKGEFMSVADGVKRYIDVLEKSGGYIK